MNTSLSGTTRPEMSNKSDTETEYPKIVEDVSTGARITFVERGIDDEGPYLVMEAVLPPETDSGPARLHPRAEARSDVVDGQAIVTVDTEEMIVSSGDSLSIAAGVPHTIRNEDDRPLIVRTTIRPPGEFEAAIRALYELGAGGRPDPLGVAAVLYHHREDVRLSGVPWGIQRPALRVLAGVASALRRSPVEKRLPQTKP